MKAIILRIKKQDSSINIFDGKNKFWIKVPKDVIKNFIEWDLVEIKDKDIKLIKRSKPISVNKCIKLAPHLTKPITTSIYGLFSDNHITSSNLKFPIKNVLLNKSLNGKEVILSNILLYKDHIEIKRYSRILVKK